MGHLFVQIIDVVQHISWAQTTKQDQKSHGFFTPSSQQVIIPPPVVLNMYGRPLHPKIPTQFWRKFLPPYRLKSALKRGHVIVTGGKSSPLKKGTMLKQLNRHVFNSPPKQKEQISSPQKTQILQTQTIQTTQRMVIYTSLHLVNSMINVGNIYHPLRCHFCPIELTLFVSTDRSKVLKLLHLSQLLCEGGSLLSLRFFRRSFTGDELRQS